VNHKVISENLEDIAATSEIVSLKDYVSLCRIKNPGRSSACPHAQCFDLGVYFTLNQKAERFKCPVCNQERAWSTLVFDEFFKEIPNSVTNDDKDGNWEGFGKVVAVNSGNS
jgi:E3 SUMO-protein ligase PIAS1